MSTDYHTPTGLSPTQANVLRLNSAVAHALPHPEETWTKHDVPEFLSDVRRKLVNFGVIEVAENRRDRPTATHLYRTKERVYEYVQENISEPNTLPCGHSGVRNIRGGGYGCQNDNCDAEFDREAAREVLW